MTRLTPLVHALKLREWSWYANSIGDHDNFLALALKASLAYERLSIHDKVIYRETQFRDSFKRKAADEAGRKPVNASDWFPPAGGA